MVEIAFREVDKGVIEAPKQWGQSFPNNLESAITRKSAALVSGLTVTTISLVGYTAMAALLERAV